MLIVYKAGAIVTFRDVSHLPYHVVNRIRIAIEADGVHVVQVK